MPYPKALLLDVDNTVYSYPECQAAGMEATRRALPAVWPECAGEYVNHPPRFENDYAKARSEVSKQIPEHGASHCRLLYFKWLIEAKLGRTDLPIAMKLHDAFWQGYFSAMRADDYCLTTLQEFKRAGVKLAWVTNFTTERQIRKLETIGMGTVADFLVTSEEAGADKPSPKPFLLALKKLKLAPADVVMVGDDWANDVEPALQLGIRPVWRKRPSDSAGRAPSDTVASFTQWTELKSLL